MTGKGGEVVFVGRRQARPDHVPQFTGLVGPAKTFKGCLFGSADIHRDVPSLVDWYQVGELQLDVAGDRTFGPDRRDQQGAGRGRSSRAR